MSNKHESWITNENGKIIAKDTTEHHDDGSSTTTHQKAYFDLLTGAHATEITGITENSPEGTSTHTEGSGSSCFLTTACVEYAGLPDDCHELTTLRQFRDRYIANLPDGASLISEYYTTAPAIVSAVHAEPRRESILAGMLAEIQSIVSEIEESRNDSALKRYRNMFNRLKTELQMT